MVPTIWPGDVVEVEKICGHVAEGDVIFTARRDAFCMHRVVRIEEDADGLRVTTRGDAMACDDPEISLGEILGKVSRVHHHGEVIRLDPRPSALQSCIARIFSSCSVVRRLLLRLNDRAHSKPASDVPVSSL